MNYLTQIKIGNILVLGTLVLILGTGCETHQVRIDLPCPTRPILQALTMEDLNGMTSSAQSKVAHNQIVLKAYAKKLETRAFCEE